MMGCFSLPRSGLANAREMQGAIAQRIAPSEVAAGGIRFAIPPYTSDSIKVDDGRRRFAVVSIRRCARKNDRGA
jgi:hypothetical protein